MSDSLELEYVTLDRTDVIAFDQINSIQPGNDLYEDRGEQMILKHIYNSQA